MAIVLWDYVVGSYQLFFLLDVVSKVAPPSSQYFGQAMSSSKKLLQTEASAARSREAFNNGDAVFVKLFGMPKAPTTKQPVAGSRHLN